MDICVDDSIPTCEKTLTQVFGRTDLIITLISIVSVIILTFTVSLIGGHSLWYNELKRGIVENWVIIVLWMTATMLSYIGWILLLYQVDSVSFVTITIFFLIGELLLLGWVGVFYYGQNIKLSLWLVGILFVYKLWLSIYIWYIKPIAAVFLIPMVIFYIYIMYSVAHLAYLNDITL